jgi:hypothetical protein
VLSRTAQTLRDEAKFGRADGLRVILRYAQDDHSLGRPVLHHYSRTNSVVSPKLANNASPPRTLALVRQSGLNEPFEERVRLIRFALKLGMILAGQEVGMIAQLD